MCRHIRHKSDRSPRCYKRLPRRRLPPERWRPWRQTSCCLADITPLCRTRGPPTRETAVYQASNRGRAWRAIETAAGPRRGTCAERVHVQPRRRGQHGDPGRRNLDVLVRLRKAPFHLVGVHGGHRHHRGIAGRTGRRVAPGVAGSGDAENARLVRIVERGLLRPALERAAKAHAHHVGACRPTGVQCVDERGRVGPAAGAAIDKRIVAEDLDDVEGHTRVDADYAGVIAGDRRNGAGDVAAMTAAVLVPGAGSRNRRASRSDRCCRCNHGDRRANRSTGIDDAQLPVPGIRQGGSCPPAPSGCRMAALRTPLVATFDRGVPARG